MKRACLMVLVLVFIIVSTTSASSSTVYSDVPHALVLINGTVIEAPTEFTGTAEICALNETIYIDSFTKYVFAGWRLENGTIVKATCVTVSQSVTALYEKYVMVVITTSPNIFTKIVWVRVGTVASIAVPEEIRYGDTLYRFAKWSGGQYYDGVTDPNLTLVLDSPLKLVAVYDELFPVYVNGRLMGYYKSGASVFIPANVSREDGVETFVKGVEAVGGAVTQISGGFMIKVMGPVNASLIYGRRYLVRVINTATNTTQEAWVEEGNQYVLRTDSVVDTGGVRWLFTGWSGDVTSPMSMTTVVVNKPMTIYANYKKQYPVKIITPLTESTVYVDAGKPFMTYVTPEYATLFKAKVLKYFLVNGDVVAPYKEGVLLIPSVNGPITVIPVYETVILWDNILITVGLTWSLVTAYFAVKYLLLKKK